MRRLVLRYLRSNLHNNENANVALIKTLTFTTPLRCILEYFDEICPERAFLSISASNFSVQRLHAKFLEKQSWPALSNGYYRKASLW